MKLTKPLIKRLIDEKPDRSIETDGQNISLSDLYADIREHLEKLLNTRHPNITYQAHHTMLKESLLNYGLKNFANYRPSSQTENGKMCDCIKELIDHYEPRLSNVNVTLMEVDEDKAMLNILIEAVLNTHEHSDAINFEIPIKN